MPIMLFVILALIFVILLIVVTNIVIVPQSMVYVVERLGELLGAPVTTSPQARFAGAIGAAVRARALV